MTNELPIFFDPTPTKSIPFSNHPRCTILNISICTAAVLYGDEAIPIDMSQPGAPVDQFMFRVYLRDQDLISMFIITDFDGWLPLAASRDWPKQTIKFKLELFRNHRMLFNKADRMQLLQAAGLVE